MADTICWAVWSSLTINNLGQYRPCCNMMNDNENPEYYLNEIGDYERFMQSNMITSLRNSMLEGKWNDRCAKCEIREKAGLDSQRNDYNKMLADKPKPSGFRLKHLDINFGNKCNLKCRMCSPQSSHLLAREWPLLDINNPVKKELYKKFESPFKINVDSLKDIIESYSHDIEILRFAGGEPLYTEEHDIFLIWLVEKGYSKNITLHYTTNGTILLQKHLDLWTNFKKVSLSLSIDAVGELNTYIRFPTSWEVIERNVRRLDFFATKHKNIVVNISSTIQALNCLRIPELLSWTKTFTSIRQVPFTKVVIHPEALDIRVLPSHLRKAAGHILNENVKNIYEKSSAHLFDRIFKIANMMIDSPQLEDMFPKFLEMNLKFDKVRKTNLLTVLPELTPYIKTIS